MSPQEQIAMHECKGGWSVVLDGEQIFWCSDREESKWLHDKIAAALAASAAKVDMLEGRLAEHDTCIAEIEKDRLAMVERENELHDEKDKKIDALTAKLEASERDRDSDRQSLMEVLKRLQESEAAREASERALERAKEFVNLKIAHRGDCVFVREDFTGSKCTCGKQVEALASPEARATGETT